MDTIFSTNRKCKRMFANILSIVAILAIAFPATGSASAQGPEPIIKISTSNNYLRADNFAPNTTVTFTVYATQNTNEDPLWSDSRVTDGSGFAIIWPWDDPQPPDLVVGNYVIANDGTNEKQLVLEQLTIDVFNPDTNLVAGTASPGDSIWVVVGNDDIGYPAGILAEANAYGIWTADFAAVYDFSNDMWGSAEVADNDWDVTVYHLGPTPTPWLIAFPENDAVEGWEWTEGATVYLTIDNAPEGFIREGTAEVTSWGDPRTYVRFDFAGEDGYDLQVGDVATLTDQFGQSTTHEVQYLSVTEVKPDADTVAGLADVDAVVQVWPHGYDQDFFIEYKVEDGTWLADFGALGFHTIEETGGRSQIVIDGNATAVDWNATYPRFTVFPEWEWFDGLDWPDRATVSISVEGKPECNLERESWGGFFNGNFPEGCNVEAGDTVTFDNGTTNRWHMVRNLAITKANYNDDTVKGIADPGAEVYVWPHATGEQHRAIAKTQGAAKGKWNVDFSGIYDLTPGECGRSEIRDELANSTAVDWCISNPRIVASEAGDWFWTAEFKPGDLDISIYDSPDEGANLLWSGQQVADESGFAFVGYDVHGQDLISGNYLVVSDGDSQKRLVLQPISVAVFDTENEIMAGFAPAGSEVWAAAGPQDWQERIMVQADPLTGGWLADFKTIGFDITEEMRPWSYAHVYDEDGDANESSTPPPMGLRVNYGHDWVESFYEAGHQVLVTLTDLDGNIKATATTVTEPKWYWGDEPGFQTLDAVWLDGEENQLESPPDIQPNDWVIAQVDNGVTAQVQIGHIQGDVRFDLDSVTGTIEVPWLTEPVPVECLDWGSGGEPVNKDAGFVYPDGASPYSCSWDPETEWDVQPWQDIGVGYSTPDGHWVANAFRDERWTAVWKYDPPAGSLQEGEHSYYYDLAYTVPEYVDYPPMDPRTFTVSGDTPTYGGYALLGPWDYMPIRVWNGSACEVVTALSLDQRIRFISGWVNDYSMTYEEALDHFNSITVDLSWNGQAINSASFTMTELLPFYGRDARIEYICTFTADLILDANAGWVDSGIDVTEGTEVTITAYGEAITADLNEYPEAVSGPGGQDWNLVCGQHEGAPPPCAMDDALYGALVGKVGENGESFLIGSNFTFTPTTSGALYLAVNDNLGYYDDNSGSYMIFIE